MEHQSVNVKDFRELFDCLSYYLCYMPAVLRIVSRFSVIVLIWLNILGWTVAQQSVILCLSWRRSGILTAYICVPSGTPTVQSSGRGLKSGDHGALSTMALLPIHRWGNMSRFRTYRTLCILFHVKCLPDETFFEKDFFGEGLESPFICKLYRYCKITRGLKRSAQ
jgi:hypothetical protein